MFEKGLYMDFKELNTINDTSLQQYRNLLSTCSDEDLTTPMPAGWTVSAVLMHLLFWDQRALTLLDKWEKDGVEFSAIDIDVVNEVTRYICLAVPPRVAMNMFLLTADALNDRISLLDPKWIVEIEEKGKNVNLNRAKHREMHLEEIKKVLERV